jgi:hypothetical protein
VECQSKKRRGGRGPARRRAALLCPALLWLAAGGRASAQDALRNALAVDTLASQQQSAPAQFAPPEHHLGPVQFTLGASTSVGYNDNINSSQTGRESDIAVSAAGNLGGSWQATERSALQFGAILGYNSYIDHPGYGGLFVSPTSALTYAIDLTEGSLMFYENYYYTREVSSQAALTGLAVLPRSDNTVGTRATWLPADWVLEAGYSHDDFMSEGAQFAYLNRTSELFNTRAGLRFGEKSQAGVEVTGGLTTYEESFQQNNQNLSVGAFVDWQITQAIHASVHGGPTVYYFDASTFQPAYEMTSYYFDVELIHQLTDFLSQRVSALRAILPGYTQGSAYIEELDVSYGLSYSLTSAVGLGLAFMYQQGTQPGGTVFFPVTENYERLGFTPALSWRCTQKLSASLSYSRWSRTSDLAGRGYTQNTAALGVNYAF